MLEIVYFLVFLFFNSFSEIRQMSNVWPSGSGMRLEGALEVNGAMATGNKLKLARPHLRKIESQKIVHNYIYCLRLGYNIEDLNSFVSVIVLAYKSIICSNTSFSR